jgi:hypothetical protein
MEYETDGDDTRKMLDVDAMSLQPNVYDKLEGRVTSPPSTIFLKFTYMSSNVNFFIKNFIFHIYQSSCIHFAKVRNYFIFSINHIFKASNTWWLLNCPLGPLGSMIWFPWQADLPPGFDDVECGSIP